METIFVGKERLYNRRFLQMTSHYLIDPVACTPASGWEKGQVESQVGTVRQRFFSSRVRVKSYEELNAWPLDKCIVSVKSSKHPEMTDKSVWQVFHEDRPHLVSYAGRFDGVHSLSAHSTIVLEPMANKVSHVEDLPPALRQQQIPGRGNGCRPPHQFKLSSETRR